MNRKKNFRLQQTCYYTVIGLFAGVLVACGASGSESATDEADEDVGAAEQEWTAYCNGVPYDTTWDICCNNVLSSKGTNNACCGTAPYDMNWYKCCNNVLSSRGTNNACCGTEPYNMSWSICCNNVLSSRGTNNACCGTEPYDMNWYKCCTGNVLRSRFSSC